MTQRTMTRNLAARSLAGAVSLAGVFGISGCPTLDTGTLPPMKQCDLQGLRVDRLPNGSVSIFVPRDQACLQNFGDGVGASFTVATDRNSYETDFVIIDPNASGWSTGSIPNVAEHVHVVGYFTASGTSAPTVRAEADVDLR